MSHADRRFSRISPLAPLLALGLLLVPAAGWAEHPYDGRWVLDVQKSKNVRLASSEQTVQVNDDRVDVAVSYRAPFREPDSFEYTLVPNGELHVVKGVRPEFDRNARAVWNGKNLEVRWEFDAQEGTVHVLAEEIWKVRRDTLEINTTFSSPQGEYKLKYVFVRQD